MKWTITFLFILFLVKMQAQSTAKDAAINSINEERFIKINGIDQWVTVKGDTTKPVVFFLHGGPGSPISPYTDIMYNGWEKDFVVVQWDQRGTGRTFGANAPAELTPEYLRANPLSIEQMTADGIEVARYVLGHLNKQKLILIGSSWGSVLGVKMAQKRPELFYAYISHSQVVNPSMADLSAYKAVVALSLTPRDEKSLRILNEIGKPPYDTARSLGKLMRIVKSYQQQKSISAPVSWFKLSSKYDNERDNRHRSDGDDYSFVNYAGDKKLGVPSMAATINFFNEPIAFKIPVYFIQGEEDLQTPAAISERYFNTLQAPDKKYILLSKTDHGFNQRVIDALYDVIKNQITPLIKK